jgi:hypothetical protein
LFNKNNNGAKGKEGERLFFSFLADPPPAPCVNPAYLMYFFTNQGTLLKKMIDIDVYVKVYSEGVRR